MISKHHNFLKKLLFLIHKVNEKYKKLFIEIYNLIIPITRKSFNENDVN